MSFIFDSSNTGNPELDEHISHVRSFDWSLTSLGPLSSWPQDLLQVAHLMMLDPQPRLLLLGSENWMFYNPAYAKAVCGDKHPRAIGMTLAETWSAEVEESVLKAPNLTKESGPLPGSVNNYHMSIRRNGVLENVVINWVMIPLAGNLNGIYVSVTDITELHLAEKRKTTLSCLQEAWSTPQDFRSFWQTLPSSLITHGDEFNFSLLYTTSTSPFKESSDKPFPKSGNVAKWKLEAFAGDVEPSISFDGESDEIRERDRLLQEATESMDPVLLSVRNRNLPGAWLSCSKKKGKHDTRQVVLICPIRSHISNKILKILVVGLDSAKSYNEDCRTWLLRVMQALEDRVTTLHLEEKEEHKRARARAEALEHAQASERRASSVTERLTRMQHLVDQVDVGIFEYLPDGTLINSNDAYHVLSNIPRTHLGVEQLAFAEYVYPEDVDYCMEKWGKMTSGTVATFEMRWKAPMNTDGEDFRWVLAACIPIVDEHGTTTSIYGCITDIGAQKRAERETRVRAEALEQARVSEQRFYRFMEHCPVAVIVINGDNIPTYANSNWYDLTGHDRVKQYNEINWASTIYPDDLETVQKSWEDMSSGLPVTVQFRLNALWKGGDGPAFQTWVMGTAWPEMEDGVHKHTIGTMTDISYLKFAEGVQKLRMKQAIEAKRQQENFIDMTSHEIRNPLGAVVHCIDAISDSLHQMANLTNNGFISSLERDKAEEFRECIDGSIEAANTIKVCTAHQKRIVDDILVLSKLDSNLLQICPSRTNALGILTSLSNMFEAEASRERIDFFTDVDASLDRFKIKWLLLDHGRINQVLINLITNAIKFTKQSKTRSITIRMGISDRRPSEEDLHVDFDFDFTLSQSMRDSIYETADSTEDELFLWFAVQDTGRGMTQEEKSRIFARFQQASPRTYSEYGGSGLGLYISHSLVGLQGGEIGVATKPGAGSTFSFFVKTSRCAPPTIDTSKPHDMLSHVASKRENTTGQRVSVLIVEDNLLNQRVLKKQLSKNYTVYTADHGQQALDFLKTTRNWRDNMTSDKSVDIILMDAEMPIMGGLECARTIRSLQKEGQIRVHIPIIVVSANARPEQIQQALEAGMDDAVSKPFRIPDLIPKMERLVNWARSV